MRQWIIGAGATDLSALRLDTVPDPTPAADEVVIKVHAGSLNFRDQAIPLGKYMGGVLPADQVPLSDGAGEVVAVGSGVGAYEVGDRVAGAFFQNWTDGPPHANAGPALGAAPAKGMLAEYVALPEKGVVRLPESLTYEEAATLPCAGVTAWNALFEGGRPVKAGEKALVLGTGGVSLLAAQFAHAAGVEVYGTSGSDEKIARAKPLGIANSVNYRTYPDWGDEIFKLTGGHGADKVIEVGGNGTLAQSMRAVAFAGEIALIGVITNAEAPPAPHALMMRGSSIRGIFVGNARMFADMAAHIDRHGIKPVIDKVFAFEDAIEAYTYQSSGALFGKVVIRIG